jgi:hypothetical protein
MNNNHNPILLKAFNNQLTEFLDDLLVILPGEKDLLVLSTFMKTVIMGKPRKIIEVWYKYITLKYRDEILNGQIEYFLNKDYSEDLQDTSSNEALDAIDKLRNQIKLTFDNEINRDKTIKYMQNLIKLTDLYYKD